MPELRSKLFTIPINEKLESCAVKDAAHIGPGSSGEHVRLIQIALNLVSSAGLGTDARYGPKTAAAVVQFKEAQSPPLRQTYQTRADNIVGIRTIRALDEKIVALEQKFDPTEGIRALERFVEESSRMLTGEGRSYFSGRAAFYLRPNVPAASSRNAIGFAGVMNPLFLTPQGMIALAALLVLAFIIALMLASKDVKVRRIGLRWRHEEETIEQALGQDTPEETARKSAKATKDAAREYIESKREAIENCRRQNENPQGACKEALLRIGRIIAEIFNKLSLNEQQFTQLIQGIGRNMAELFQAMRDAATFCRNCGDLL